MTPPSGAKRLAAGLTGSLDVGLEHLGVGFAPRSHPFNVGLEHLGVGFAPRSHPFNAKSEHGFYGIEDEVVSRIATFIRAHTDP